MSIVPALVAWVGLQTATAGPTTADLIEDLNVIETALPQHHLDFGKLVPPAEWRRRCESARRDLPRLSGPARVLRMAQLVASVGVAHTWVSVGDQPWSVLPIRFRAFGDGLFVHATTEELKDLAGAQVLAVGGRGEKEIVRRLGGLEPSENDRWRRARVADWCGAGDAYAATGLAETASRIRFRFRMAGGKVVDRWIEASPERPSMKLAVDSSRAPEFMRRMDAPYRLVAMPERKTLVLDFRRCAPDPALPMAKLAESFWKTYGEGGYARAVVDLRRNGGGDSSVLRPFLQSLAQHKNTPLFALISNETFSSGMMNAVELRAAGAILVGEPTGGSPNSYGEQKRMTLPRTGMELTWCTKFFRLGPDARATTVEPDVRVRFAWADYASGRDPVWDALDRSRKL